MANNPISYNRFTALPSNIAQYGYTQEEVASQRGTPDPDPVLSPMAQVEKPNAQLALARPGSDKLRLNQPQDPVYNPYEGQKPTLVLSRHAVTKLNGAVVGQLKSLVASGSISDPQVKTQMEHSLKRIGALAEFLDYQNQLTDQIYARTLSVSKG